MVCLHYKKETSISKLRDMMGTDLKGTNLIGLTKCAEELGFVSQAIRIDKEGFMSDFTLPCIANVITKEGLTHFVVIFKILKNHVVIGDPSKDLTRMTIDEFYKGFTGVLLLLSPNQEFVAGKERGKSVFQRYMQLLLPQKKLFIYGIITSVLLTILGIVSSLFNSIIYDEILPYRQVDALNMLLFIFAGIAITQAVLSFVRQWMMIYLSVKIDIPLMLGYFKHIYHLPMSFFLRGKPATLRLAFLMHLPLKMYLPTLRLHW